MLGSGQAMQEPPILGSGQAMQEPPMLGSRRYRSLLCWGPDRRCRNHGTLTLIGISTAAPLSTAGG